jgi:hypothetical protein
MSETDSAAAPESGTTIPTFEELAADPQIAPLLDFAPVPRSHVKANGWTPDMQRMFIAWLAYYGSPTNACDELGMARSGIDKVYKSADADEFRASWDAAVALAEKRRIAALATRRGGAGALRAPAMSRSRPDRTDRDDDGAAPLPGQVMNELGDWESEDSLERRADEARDSIARKLLAARRLYLQEIAGSPGKRAAFEILTELPIDWAKAQRLEPQADEPWRRPNLRQGDMLLTAENGWLGDFAHGPDKVAELRRAIDRYREEQGLERVRWDEDPLPSEGEGRERGQ